jgi:Domain of unknown function (DUF1905)/Bacteriocin-protection, YdeI or OmpD-Associated
MTKATSPIHFSAKLHRPAGSDKGASWLFLNLPDAASQQLPARSMVSVEGTFNGKPFATTLEPDGQGGHWLKLQESIASSLGVKAGDAVELVIAPAIVEPEPVVPEDVQTALESAHPKAMETWLNTSAIARRDWIKWITSGKKAETRLKRIEVAISKMSAGSKRPCCFDRSGMYDKSLSCPIAEEE